MLLIFIHNGNEIQSFRSNFVPRDNQFIKIYNDDEESIWRVRQIENVFSFKTGFGELEPYVNVYLRRLRPGEYGNKDDFNSYSKEKE